MQVLAKWKYLRASPQKVRLVADLVRGLPAGDALAVLQRTNKRAARQITKVLESAVANADNQGGNPDDFVVDSIIVNEGPRSRRMRAAARGRSAPYRHRMSHIVVTLSDDHESEEADDDEELAGD